MNALDSVNDTLTLLNNPNVYLISETISQCETELYSLLKRDKIQIKIRMQLRLSMPGQMFVEFSSDYQTGNPRHSQ